MHNISGFAFLDFQEIRNFGNSNVLFRTFCKLAELRNGNGSTCQSNDQGDEGHERRRKTVPELQYHHLSCRADTSRDQLFTPLSTHRPMVTITTDPYRVSSWSGWTVL
ncbi:unnamed protein product [Cylicocyclus nassatus]|uniref:Uncharacterized protein n=1 Tax=Cylicocyclus nassatus TaxID=53992 RepID=A0AA36MIC3_CYLNA|nr:unnamed protein product [Cylicocyclus nassatus]